MRCSLDRRLLACQRSQVLLELAELSTGSITVHGRCVRHHALAGARQVRCAGGPQGRRSTGAQGVSVVMFLLAQGRWAGVLSAEGCIAALLLQAA